ncbi:MAG TPA: hypothetical protein VE422_03200 [Terriglobia bacterium]|nr:hypothetical protein [Terriglobia bacterium]
MEGRQELARRPFKHGAEKPHGTVSVFTANFFETDPHKLVAVARRWVERAEDEVEI